MADRQKDALRERFDRELSDLTARAAQPDLGLEPERLAALNRLAQLIAVRDSMRAKRRNWLSALVLLGTLAIVSLLLFATVSETDIELELAVTEVAFDLSKEQVLTEPLQLAALGVSGLRAWRLPPGGAPAEPHKQVQHAILLSAASDGPLRGSVSLAPWRTPAGKRLALQRSSRANGYRLSIDGGGLVLQAAVNGPVTLGPSGAAAQTRVFASPQPVVLEGGSQALDLDLEFGSLPQRPLAPQLEVRNLSLARINEFAGADRTLVRRVSTILGGTLHFESLDGKERRVRPGEQLRFEASEGELRTLELTADSIALKFHGRVRGMTIGSDENRRSLMPTYLEWLQARHALSLLWGTSLYIAGLVAAALRWWGLRP
jgi:hypothetical protein